jgi:hypothetical protein
MNFFNTLLVKMKFFLIIAFIHLSAHLMSQTELKVEVSTDTVTPGEIVQVVFTIENGDGRFEPPDMSALPLVSGPNSSSSFMIRNGIKSSSQSYTYIFLPVEEGKIKIPEAHYYEEDNKQAFEPITIVVTEMHTTNPVELNKNQSLKAVREKRKF